MDYFLLIFGFILMILGIIGSLLPIIPGPPLSWLGLLSLFFVDKIQMPNSLLITTAIVALIVTALDYYIPSKGTKYFGGTKYGVWGTNIGLLIGVFFPPFGIILGPFIGALIGELIKDQANIDKAFKAALGSFIGFLMSTIIKLVVCIIFFMKFLALFWENYSIWF